MKKLFTSVALLCCMLTAHAQWNTTGNAATSTNFLGTNNNISLRIRTNNVQRMIIDSLGRVGVGIAFPRQLFTVQSSGTVPAAGWITSGAPVFAGYGEGAAGNADFNLLMASSTATNARGVFGMKRSRGTLAAPAAVLNNDQLGSLLVSGYDGTNFQGAAAVDFFADGTPTAGNVPVRISFVTGSNSTNRSERLRIGNSGDISMNGSQFFLQNSTGNIGIGSILPQAKLDIAGQIKITDGTQGTDKVLTSDSAGKASWKSIPVQVEADPKVGSSSANRIAKWNGAMLVDGSITDNGNVGIGTTTPGATLHVAGSGSTLRVEGLAGSGTGRLVSLSADGTLQAQSQLYGLSANEPPQTPSAVGAPVSTENFPAGTVLSPDGKRAFVINRTSKTLQVFDISNVNAAPTAIGTVGTDASPFKIEINSIGTRVYVVNKGSNTLQAYDISNASAAPVPVGTAVSTGNGPASVAVNAAGTRAYVVNSGSNTLQAYDISNANAAPVAIGAAVATGTAPNDVAVNATGTRAYVVNYNSNTLQAYDITNTNGAPVAVGSAVATGNAPRNIVLNAAGTRAYVINYNSNTLQAYNISNMNVAPVAIGSAASTGDNPNSVAVNMAGTRAYIVNFSSNTLQTYNISDTNVAPIAEGPAVTTDAFPAHIAVNKASTRAYVLCLNTFTMQAYSVASPPRLLTQGADGSFGTTTSAALDATTASNGLSLAGTDVRLGGSLTAATNIAQAGNVLSFTGANVGIGTTTPTDHLHIYGAGSQGIMLESPTGTSGLTVSTALYKCRTWSGTALNTYVAFGGTDDNASSLRASIYVPNAANTGVREAVSVLKASGNVGIGTTTPAGLLELSLDQGRKPGTSTWTIVSDSRLKNIEGNYTKGLKDILQLQPILYHYTNAGKRKFNERVLTTQQVGFSAQDVQKVFPEAVGTDDDGYLNLNIHPILIAQVNALKEQQQQIATLQQANAELVKVKNEQAAMNSNLQKQIDELKEALMKLVANKTPCTSSK